MRVALEEGGISFSDDFRASGIAFEKHAKPESAK
jgi:hypothetical protein